MMSPRTRNRHLLMAALPLLALWSSGGRPAMAGAPAPKAPADTVALEPGSFWRTRLVWETDQVRRESGKLVHVLGGKTIKTRDKKTGKTHVVAEINPTDRVVRLPELPPADWMQPEFDDSGWGLFRGPFDLMPVGAKLLFARGRFEVTNPGGVRDLKLSLAFEGGAIVFLNGKELTRSGLPGGRTDMDTPALDYPPESYVDAKGNLFGYDTKDTDRLALRSRRIEGFKVPASALRKGVNVLAVEVHRAPAREVMYITPRTQKGGLAFHPGTLSQNGYWARMGLTDVRLAAPPGAPIVPNAGHAGAPRGFRVWNWPALSRDLDFGDYSDPCEPLRPIRIYGAANGVFCGQVVVSSDAPVRGLSAKATELRGPGGAVIASDRIELRFARPGISGGNSTPKRTRFDALDTRPPEDTPAAKNGHGKSAGPATVPVWLCVRVPEKAAGGRYGGTLTVSAAGRADVKVPVELEVAAWRLPAPQDFGTFMGFVQSPESVAEHYQVSMWSEKHYALLAQSFRLLGEIGNKVVYINFIRRTHFGNPHGMVRWSRGADGSLKPDFSVAEKYLDAAVGGMGKVPVVCCYCWNAKGSQGQLEFQKEALKDREILISLLKPGGELEEAVGPKWGTPACRAFWKPALEGMQALLTKRGMGGAMMLGVSGDRQPTEAALDDLSAAAPKAKWVVHAHNRQESLRGRPVGYLAAIWGIGAKISEPEDGHRGHGWRDPFLTAYIRGVPGELEAWLSAPGIKDRERGVKGFAWSGADFWPVLKHRGRGRTLIGRYPEAQWSALDMRWRPTYIIAPGTSGPVPTVRFEVLRAEVQQCQARIFIEKALLDPRLRARLGADLAARCQKLLDDRIRVYFRRHQKGPRLPRGRERIWFGSSGWERSSGDIYRLAAEVAARLGR